MKITGEMHFAKALSDLAGRGVDLRDVTPGELYALAGAARRCANPYSAVNAELAGEPVRVCEGVWIWPPTAGALIWLEEYAGKWWAPESLAFHWAHVYALVHAREPEAFARLTDMGRARRAVIGCALRLAVHGRELAAAIRKAYGEDEFESLKVGKFESSKPSSSKTSQDFAQIVARLEVQSGIPRDTWLWRRSLMYIYTAYADLRNFAAACAGKGGEVRMIDELDEALTDFAKAKAVIFRRLAASGKRKDQEHAADGGGDDGQADRKVAEGEPPRGGVVLDEQPAGHAHEEGVVGGGGSGGGAVVHDGADYSKSGRPNQ